MVVRWWLQASFRTDLWECEKSKFLPMNAIMFFIQQPNIEKKMEEAPDSAYEIGVVIGSYLPFVVLVIIAYLIYNYNKKRRGES